MNRQISLAPMLDWTDRHFRYFIRLLSPHIVLYTEMITTGAILHGDANRHLQFNQEETPVALQLGGSDPSALAQCAKIAADYGYDEINLNVGCPSDRVQNGSFGACLMNEPELVASCVAAMKESVNLPVTVKTRIGVDDNDSYEALTHFTKTVYQAGCEHLIVHARKAWLKGLSPKENRTIPPLRYDIVYQLKKDFPQLPMTINGGIKSVEEVKAHLEKVDGVMIGREACQNPWFFKEVEQAIFGASKTVESPSINLLEKKKQLVMQYMNYMEEQVDQGVRLATLIRPIMCLFNGLPGAKQWRRHLSTYAPKNPKSVNIVLEALAFLCSIPC